MDVYTGNKQELEQTLQLALKHKKNLMISCMNPHSFCLFMRDKSYRQALDSTDILLCDGVGFQIVERFINHKMYSRITGLEVTEIILNLANHMGLKVSFIGSTEDNLEVLKMNVGARYQNIQIAAFAPPFAESFGENEYRDIKNFLSRENCDLVFFGLTAPKQECLSWSVCSPQNKHVVANVGAVFDYLSGRRRVPPIFIRKIGLEWLWRLVQDPRKLIKRTLVSAPLYLYCRLREKLYKYLTFGKLYILSIMRLLRYILRLNWKRNELFFYLKGSFLFRAPKLDDNAIIMDVGAYTGFFTEVLALRNPEAKIMAYEPVSEFHDKAKLRLMNYPNVYLKKYGLAASRRSVQFHFEGDATRSSAADGGQKAIVVEVQDIFDEIKSDIDFMTMNIEGGEYEILERLITTGSIKSIKELQIQFHFYEKNHEDLYNIVTQNLAHTHKRVWVVDRLWEHWVKLPAL
jgi:N-acetylglucosaminyldiphosphoundecaprenol N-acetyl-beta-D-mannosaminyltransferase